MMPIGFARKWFEYVYRCRGWLMMTIYCICKKCEKDRLDLRITLQDENFR